MRICVTTGVWEACAGRIRAIAPGLEVTQLRLDGTFDGDTADVEAFFFSEDLYRQPTAVRAAMGLATGGGLRWFHSSSAGIDHPIFQQIVDAGATLTHSPGQHGQPIAEYVLGHMLAAAKRMRAHAALQAEHRWEPIDSVELTGATVGIVGYGGIGAHVARLARAFEMRVLATKRTPIEDPNVDELLPPKRLHELLAASDYVVVTVPLTDESRGMFGAAEFAAMRPEAVFINVARGGVVQEDALGEALRSGSIALAVLDVAGEEPLPPESPLWELPNCVITPHDSGSSPLSFERTNELWLRNLSRWVRGEELLHVAAGTGLSG